MFRAVDTFRRAQLAGIARSPGALEHWLKEGAFPFDESAIEHHDERMRRADLNGSVREMSADDVRDLVDWARANCESDGEEFARTMEAERYRIRDAFTERLVAEFCRRRAVAASKAV